MAALNAVAVSMQSCTYTKRELTVPCLQMFMFQDGTVPQGDAGDAYKGMLNKYSPTKQKSVCRQEFTNSYFCSYSCCHNGHCRCLSL